MDSKITYQTELFANRLTKKYKLLRKWARNNRVTCYRIYDRDIPEIPVSVDIYEFLPQDITNKLEAAHFTAQQKEMESQNILSFKQSRAQRQYIQLYLYERPYEKDENEETQWLIDMAEVASKVFEIDKTHIIIKNRKHSKGGSQYAKDNPLKPINALGKECPQIKGIIQECGELFEINLTDYLDTGLFLDHRALRRIVRDSSNKASVLNLFCYTSSFSVYAAEGLANRVESIDLSNTYLAWAKRNLTLNEFTESSQYIETRSDVEGFLNQKNAEVPKLSENGQIDGTNRYNLIVLDPPTFSNSKKTESSFDINKDYVALVNKCLEILLPGGVLYFSTNSRRLKFNSEEITKVTKNMNAVMIEDITEKTMDEDFKGSKIHRVWKFTISKNK